MVHRCIVRFLAQNAYLKYVVQHDDANIWAACCGETLIKEWISTSVLNSVLEKNHMSCIQKRAKVV